MGKLRTRYAMTRFYLMPVSITLIALFAFFALHSPVLGWILVGFAAFIACCVVYVYTETRRAKRNVGTDAKPDDSNA